VRSRLFDFQGWSDWLRIRASVLDHATFKTNDKYLHGACLEVTGGPKLASFRCFENGLVDYEVMDSETKEWIAIETMIPVTDVNFQTTFDRFVDLLKTD
jgi:hypothetical protein